MDLITCDSVMCFLISSEPRSVSSFGHSNDPSTDDSSSGRRHRRITPRLIHNSQWGNVHNGLLPSATATPLKAIYIYIGVAYCRSNCCCFISSSKSTTLPSGPLSPYQLINSPLRRFLCNTEMCLLVVEWFQSEPRCLLNTKITGDDAPGETWHMVFSTEGEVPYREGQSIGVIADGLDKNGKPHKLRLYSIASSALGDFGDSKTASFSLCQRLVYTNENGELVKGVCSNFLCDLKPGAEVKITGPVGKEMLMPKDPNATIIMLGTELELLLSDHSCGKCSLRSTKTTSSMVWHGFSWVSPQVARCYIKRLDFAVSREQKNEKGEKMYIQTRMAQYAEELWELLKKDNTYVYMCGLKGMEKGIDDIMVSLAAKEGIDWVEYKRQLKKAEQWNVEVY
ncbi:hypothetical protein FNV43_RR18689 [Rhamnella rubrinervis]|uniref:ferredoxin--NADP(+) reductase n=1 Tax=Rhamnella rubrinervis TaxID=2594499 RepID=A0A8K0DZU8_9ROSA|nr:hypothetical protein FNV43_RR18689 [Rhamnella rubrinervis]